MGEREKKTPQCCIAGVFTFGIPHLVFVSKSILRFVPGYVKKCDALSKAAVLKLV